MKESNQGNPDGLACPAGEGAGKGARVGAAGRRRVGATSHLHPESAFPSPELRPGPLPAPTLAAEGPRSPPPLWPHLRT